MSDYVCYVCRGRDECVCDGRKLAEERDELLQKIEQLEPVAIDQVEAAALLKVLSEVDFVGAGAFARLTSDEEGVIAEVRVKLTLIAEGD